MGKLIIFTSKYLFNVINIHLPQIFVFQSNFQISLDRSKIGKSGCCFIIDWDLMQYNSFLRILLKSKKKKKIWNIRIHMIVYISSIFSVLNAELYSFAYKGFGGIVGMIASWGIKNFVSFIYFIHELCIF